MRHVMMVGVVKVTTLRVYITPDKGDVGADALSQNEEENYGTEDLCGMIKNLEPRADGTLCLKNRNIDVSRFDELTGGPNAKQKLPYTDTMGVDETTLEEVGLQDHGVPVLIISDRRRSYADKRRKPLEFQVGDKVMLKVSPWKGVIRFGKRGKLNPRYIGPFKILAKVGTVAYRLELPEKLSRVHSTFHVSNLKKCLSVTNARYQLDGIHVGPVDSRRGHVVYWVEKQSRKSTLISSLTMNPRLMLRLKL
ncbi:hypothetical protein Tco_1491360 [Tanacetum coccineum]